MQLGLAAPMIALARKGSAQSSSTYHYQDQGEVPGTIPSRTDPQLFAGIRSEWANFGLGDAPGHPSSLLLTGGYRSISKVVALIFAEPVREPRLVVKMPRVPESMAMLRREASILRSVHQLRPGGVPGVPRVLSYREDTQVLALTAFTGTPVNYLLRQQNFRDFGLKAAQWLAGLASGSPAVHRDRWWGPLVEPIVNEFEQSFAEVLDRGMLAQTKAVIAEVNTLPLMCEQADFSPWNVMVTPAGDLAVLDWESADLQGLPVLDLLYFLSYCLFCIDGTMASPRAARSYKKFFDPTTVAARVCYECLEYYTSNIGLDPASLPALRLILWMRKSRWEYQRLMADAKGRSKREALQSSLFVNLWQQEVRHLS